MRNIGFLGLLALLSLGVGCGDANSGNGGTGGGTAGAGGASGSGGTQSQPFEVTEDSFDCIQDGTKVRNFFVKNLLGDLDASVAVALGDAPFPYPPGTLLQLVPQEAMVKREVGFSPETRDWEFFFMNVSEDGTTIVERGKDEAENAFGGNCFECHSAATETDFVCESDNGCVPLTIGIDLIESLQQQDPRCN